MHLAGLLALCPAQPPFNVAPLVLTVSEPQAGHSPLEKPPSTAILCDTCGNVCKGEVLRVQNKYFHIKCFICKGECLSSVWATVVAGTAPRCGLQPRPPSWGSEPWSLWEAC